MSYDHKKLAFFLPNTFTALNMGCGFYSIILAFQGEFYKACLIIVLGALFDSVDGRIARLTGTQSSFGEQFDSMSDLITFGMAPALLYFLRYFQHLGRLGILLSFFFCLAGALRLARFNANIDKVKSDYFQGLPIPGGATAAISLVLFSVEFPVILEYSFIPVIYISFYSVLMISNIPFPSFKNSLWIKNHKKQALLVLFIIIGSIFLYEEVMIPFYITLYVVLSLLFAFLNRKKMAGIFEFHPEPEDNESH